MNLIQSTLNRIETSAEKRLDWKKDSAQTIADTLWARKGKTYSSPVFQIDDKIGKRIITQSKGQEILDLLKKKGYKPKEGLTERR